MKQKKRVILKLAMAAVLLFPLSFAYSQIMPAPDMDAVRAEEEFRSGVAALNRFSYNEAVRAFETALSYRPGEAVLLDYLGRAYFKSGLETEALRQWEWAASIYGEGSAEAALLLSKIETVRARQSQEVSISDNYRLVEEAAFQGLQDRALVFNQPVSILGEKDGRFWTTAYTSNELLLIDVNGVVRQRERGPLGGFDRPYGLARGLDGRMYVSEFRGGRVSVLDPNGKWQSYAGSKGVAEGQLVGPSSITIDNEGYVYVVEYGNRRISKFSPDGEFVLTFGQKDADFAGLFSPTGIIYHSGRIFQADNLRKTIYTFNTDGVYEGIFRDTGLEAPEALRFWDEDTILVADSRRILLIDTNSAEIREAGFSGNRTTRVLDADIDSNGSVVASNFDKNEISIMQNITSLASGLFVEVTRALAENFPEVTLEVTVTDRKGKPVSGLTDINFVVSEGAAGAGGRLTRVGGLSPFIGSFDSNEGADVAVVIERSFLTRSTPAELQDALKEIYIAAREAGANVVSIISAGENPEKERFNIESPASFVDAARGQNARWSPKWRLDTALRLAADDLLQRSKRRSVILVTSGITGDNAFPQYTLTGSAAYLKSSGVGFYTITLGDGGADDALNYLADAAGGKSVSLYASEGIAPIFKHIVERNTGQYLLRYRSSQETNFGKNFLPVEVEVYVLERSGRDRRGFFAPLS